MNGTRKAGLILAGIASAMWLGALAAFLGTGPEDGVSLGGALLALLAVPVSIAAAGILLASLLAGQKGVPPLLRVAAGLAVVSVPALLAFLVMDPYAESATAQFTALGVGVVAFLASSVLFAAASRPPGRRVQSGR